MPQKDPKHNLTALLLGTGEFSFSEGAVSVADSRLRGWLDFGNIVAFTPNRETTTEDHFGSYRGVRKKDKIVATESGIEYTLRCDEWNYKVLEALFGGSSTTGHTQTISTAAPITLPTFSSGSPSGTQKWYDIIRTADSVHIRNVTSVSLTGKVEGTDYEIDLTLGRIRFLISQTAAITTPTVTAPAIAAGENAAFLGMTPLADPIKEGFGRLIIWDQHDPNKISMEHIEFACQVTAESAGEVDGTGFTEITLRVLVTDPVGKILIRNQNDN